MRRRLGFGVLSLGILAFSLFAGPAREARAADAAADYQIGPGDVLKIEVVGRPDLSGTFTVNRDGLLSMPIVGSMDATGRTARDLATDLSRRISLFQREIPQVTVTVTESKSRRIFVLGAVLLPGSYPFGDLPSVWEAITEAGGPAEDAQLSAVEVIPGDLAGGRATQVVDVATIIRENRMDSLPRLQPGDTVRVPRGRSLASGVTDVYIFGAVARQGSLPVEQASDLVTALIRSGGPAPDADLRGVDIVRKSGARVVRLKVSMENYLEKANTSGNPPLEPGDTIYVRRRTPGGGGIFAAIRTIGPVLALVSAVTAIAYRR